MADGTVQGNGVLPNGNAILELESSNKGLLHTRVALSRTTDATPLAQHVAGMMVYNTATTNDVRPGIYYNNGSRWVLAAAGEATSITYNPVTYEITYQDNAGNLQVIDLTTVVQGNETLTLLVENSDGTLSYTDEHGVRTDIDLPNLVREHEALTSFSYDLSTGMIAYVDEEVNVTELDMRSFVRAHETVTSLTYDAATYTLIYVREDGNTETVDLSGVNTDDQQITDFSLSGDVLTLTLEDGGSETVDLSAYRQTVTAFSLDADNVLTITLSNGNTETVDLSTLADGDISSTDGVITVTDGENSTFKDVQLTVNANNGLSVADNNIQLGGNLVKPTIIGAGTTNTLAITGLQPGSVPTDNLMVIGTDGVLKTAKSAMPKFFYMPAVIFDTSTPGTFTRDLYEEYLRQFTGVNVSITGDGNNIYTGGLIGSVGAPAAIPHLPQAEDLFYYITYYDQGVITINPGAITATGEFTYTVTNPASESSYMNIVFVIKD